jgi:hypothetical protein
VIQTSRLGDWLILIQNVQETFGIEDQKCGVARS